MKEIIKETSEKRELFPAQAVDLNKLPNKEGLWDLPVADANRMTGASLRNPKTIGDIIFYLNMVAMRWEDSQK